MRISQLKNSLANRFTWSKKVAAITAGGLALSAVIAWAGLVWADHRYPLHLPGSDTLFAKVVVDRDGYPLRAFPDVNGVWRYEVSLDDVSPLYLEALLAYEDRRFWDHHGVDPMAMLRALGLWAYHGRVVSGGSTITMQVARLLHPHSRTLRGKSYQMFRAWQLERHLTKREILTLYCNIAPFGGTIEGVQAASFTYLNKSAANLTPAEAALLAVLPQRPTRIRPDLNPEDAQAARDKVLDRLASFGLWSEAAVAEAKLEPVQAMRFQVEPHAALLARRLTQNSNERVVHTTVVRDWQLALEDTLVNAITAHPDHTSAAAMVVSNLTGDVLAYAGTAEFGNRDRFGHVDMITATRSPGSTLKPFLYGFALEDGLVHEQSLLADVPLEWQGYRPHNFTGGYSGPVSVSDALQRSLNIPAVQLLDQYGSGRFYARLGNAGVNLSLPAGKPNLAMILGGSGSTLENLVTGYTAFANGGITRPLRYQKGEATQPRRYLMSEGAAWVVQNILKGVGRPERLRRVSSLASRETLAWKTGTSYGNRDAWAIGVDAKVTIGVWVGRPDGSFMPDNSGREAAGPILHAIADWAAPHPVAIAKPANVAEFDVCWPLGTLKTEQDSALCHKTKTAWLIDQTAPPTLALPHEPSADRKSVV